jgi:hypothetical protein
VELVDQSVDEQALAQEISKDADTLRSALDDYRAGLSESAQSSLAGMRVQVAVVNLDATVAGYRCGGIAPTPTP